MYLIENAEIYAPEKLGRGSVLFLGDHILRIGKIDKQAILDCGLDVQVIDADGELLVPGLIDVHEHLLGGSGENGGFSTQTPEISLHELLKSGITTVVGTLGADTTMKTMPGLLAKAKAFYEEGLTAFIWTGGYSVPPTSILEDCAKDIMFISEVIGTGEIAVNDQRSVEPEASELARVIHMTHLAGMLTDKSGVTHFHVGEGKRILGCIHDTLAYAPDIDPSWLYLTHINRNTKILKQAIELSKKGVKLDMDCVDQNVHEWIPKYLNHGGSLDKLTISSDAGETSPANLLSAFKTLVHKKICDLQTALKLVTQNPAAFLKFKRLGQIREGFVPSLTVLERGTLEVMHVVSRGKLMVFDGELCQRESFIESSNREIHLVGDKAPSPAH